MMLAVVWTAFACALPAAHATLGLHRHVQMRRSSPVTKAELLQHNATRKSLLHQPEGGMPSDFFTHDAEKMDELPQYTSGGTPKGCHPKCNWSCGGGCDQVCTPVCAPPKCEVTCPQLAASMCQQRCAPPKCAVVCPTNACERDDCPKCKTVCGPPDCHAHCADNCVSQCAEPQCSWTCKPSDACVQPDCKLDCNHPKICNFNANNDAGHLRGGLAGHLDQRVNNDAGHLRDHLGFDGHLDQRVLPWLHDNEKSTMSQGLASLDPTTLVSPDPMGVANNISKTNHGPDHVQFDPNNRTNMDHEQFDRNNPASNLDMSMNGPI